MTIKKFTTENNKKPNAHFSNFLNIIPFSSLQHETVLLSVIKTSVNTLVN